MEDINNFDSDNDLYRDFGISEFYDNSDIDDE